MENIWQGGHVQNAEIYKFSILQLLLSFNDIIILKTIIYGEKLQKEKMIREK